MSEAEHLADALRGLFSNVQHGWFAPVSASVEGITAEQAATVPAERFNSVWAVVNHLRFWQEFVRIRLQGREVDRAALGSEDGWPALPNTVSEEEWRKSCQEASQINEMLADHVCTLADEELSAPYAGGRTLRVQLIHGLIAHNCYHACEIVSIRHMLGLWLARTQASEDLAVYNHAPKGYRCPLCAISRGEIEEGPLFSIRDLIYADDAVCAMISAYQWPRNPGNVVVFPSSHYENIYELPIALAAGIHELTREIALAMKAAWKCDGISTRQHNEPAGNQDTWHYHMHVTPRFHGDDLYRTYVTGKTLMPAGERARYAVDLAQVMKGGTRGPS